MKLDMRLGDCLDVLPQLAAGSVHTCICSPPYWGLRDYGTATWEGGDGGCDHKKSIGASSSSGLNGSLAHKDGRIFTPYANECGKCGARRIDSQLGLEATPEEFVAKMVEVFRAVRRVLRDDGTLWLNMGDRSTTSASKAARNGLKTKNLFGMPWRTAFALQADGWYLRSDIIWAKKNCMPESCDDRPTKSHEYLFLLTKSAKYFYDADAIREPLRPGPRESAPYPDDWHERYPGLPDGTGNMKPGGRMKSNPAGRNKRSVWTIATQAFSKAHFATFPEKLVLPCILAGTSEEGCCAECGAPWERVVEKERKPTRPGLNTKCDALSWDRDNMKTIPGRLDGNVIGNRDPQRHETSSITIGWQPTCTCNADTVPCTVLDPFLGSGTTAKVSQQYGRSFVGCELSAEYLELARDRFKQSRLFA